MKSERKLFWKIVGAYAVLGPPIGGFFFGCLMIVTLPYTDYTAPLIVALFSYFLGVPSAVLAGITVAINITKNRAISLYKYYVVQCVLPFIVFVCLLPLTLKHIHKAAEVSMGHEETRMILINNALKSLLLAGELFPVVIFASFIMLRLTKHKLAGTPYALRFKGDAA